MGKYLVLYIQTTSHRYQTAKNIDAILRLPILLAIGHMKIDSVKSYHLQYFLNTQAGKSNSQLQKIRGVITQIFERTELDRINNHTPARKLFLPKGTEKTARSIKEVERLALYKAIETHRGKI
ncbi:hypothetical protein [Candidatus Agathobaculum pullicola]|uniref:hypothetical protein n=1 Tax=Candidatus Agathobaculum pullicola TaxID=2838426 RepID=UPI003F8EB687